MINSKGMARQSEYINGLYGMDKVSFLKGLTQLRHANNVNNLAIRQMDGDVKLAHIISSDEAPVIA